MNRFTKNFLDNLTEEDNLFFIKIYKNNEEGFNSYIKSKNINGLIIEKTNDNINKEKEFYKNNYGIFFNKSTITDIEKKDIIKDSTTLNDIIIKYDIDIIDVLYIGNDDNNHNNVFDILKQLNMKKYRPYLIIIDTSDISQDKYNKITDLFEKYNYAYFIDKKNRIAAIRSYDIYLDDCDEFIYKIIWDYYLSKKWSILIKYCYIYLSRYENKYEGAVDIQKYQYCLFFLAFGYGKTGNLDATKVIYDEILNMNNLNKNIKEWTEYNIKLINKD